MARGSTNSRRNTSKYTLRRGNKIRYVGITNNPKRRASEHKRAAKSGKMRIEGKRVSRSSARKWEKITITNYRRRNGRGALSNRA